MDVYKDRADMITVYIEEAHAADEWFVQKTKIIISITLIFL